MARPPRPAPLRLLLLLILSVTLAADSASVKSCTNFVNNIGSRRLQRTIRCNHGNLTRVPQRPPNLHMVSELLLDDNRLARLDEHSFYSWPDLEHLSLRNNWITRVGVRTFKPLRRLRRLNLSGNRLHLPNGLPPMALAHVTDLLELDLSFNPLIKVPAHHFQVLGNLQVLVLRGTRPSLRLGADSFAGLQRVHTLDLTSNYLRSLPEAAFRETRLSTMLLGGANPWRCDCRVRWLKLWQKRRLPLRSRIFLEAPDREPFSALRPTCHSPKRLKGRDLLDLDLTPGDFQCAPEVRGGDATTGEAAGHQTLRVHAGDNVSFTCAVYADPLSGLDWFKDGSRVTPLRLGRPFVKSRSAGVDVKAFLHLPAVRPSDAGRWACMAWNREGQAVQSYDLSVVPFCPAHSLTSGILGVAALIAWALFLLAIGLFCFYSLRRRQRHRLSVRRAKQGEAACNLYQEEKL